MTTPQKPTIEQVRAALAGAGEVREVRMFGGTAFMVDDSLAVSVGKGGDLLVRIDPARNDELLARPGAHPAVMGERSMGPCWIRVDVAPGDLPFWVDVALQRER